MTSLPDWMVPPRPQGWYAEDLDRLPDAPRHTELIDGALIFMMSPQRSWHGQVIFWLRSVLTAQRPAGVRIESEMTVRLDERNRPEPDVIAVTAPYAPDRTWYDAAEVLLAVEVTSPESQHRDRTVKLTKYAAAGIRNYWLIDDEDGRPVVHAFELDATGSTYVPVGIFRDRLQLTQPFPIDFDLTDLDA